MASGWVRCWAAGAMCSTELIRRLPVKSSRCRPAGVVRVSGAICSKRKRPTLDLAGCGELVTRLGGQLGDLVRDVVKHQSASSHKGSAMLEHCLDLRDGGVVGVECLHRPQSRLGQQRPR